MVMKHRVIHFDAAVAALSWITLCDIARSCDGAMGFARRGLSVEAEIMAPDPGLFGTGSMSVPTSACKGTSCRVART
jgi:hypothetical protein